jgi:hypothetical protein
MGSGRQAPVGTPNLGTEAGLTPQMAIVDAAGRPTLFFFRWLLTIGGGAVALQDLLLLEGFDAGEDLLAATAAAGQLADSETLAALADAGAAAAYETEASIADTALAASLSTGPNGATADADQRALEVLMGAPPVTPQIVIPASAPVLASDAGETIIAATLPTNDVWVGDAAGVPTPTPLSAIAGAPPLAAQQAFGTADLTLGASPAPIPGASVTVAAAGTYLVIGIYDFYCDAPDAGASTFQGGLDVASSFEPPTTVFAPGFAGSRIMIGQQWIIAAAAGTVFQLMGFKSGGSGGSLILARGATTNIVALRVA